MAWFKWIPHPNYGNYCGKWNEKKRENGIEPIDDLDAACQLHDYIKDDKLFADLLRESMKIKSSYGCIYQGVARWFFKQ